MKKQHEDYKQFTFFTLNLIEPYFLRDLHLLLTYGIKNLRTDGYLREKFRHMWE